MLAQQQKIKSNCKISIVGDSISTYIGCNPYNYPVYYRDDIAYDNEIESVNDTWWKQVIDSLGGELCVNNSYSGSLVAWKSEVSACSPERCAKLHTDVKPDIILIYMGTNDRGFEVDVGIESPQDIQKFYGAYRAMLRQLKTNYPDAKIICATLLVGRFKDNVTPFCDSFTREDERYNEAIRLAVKEESCILADIALSGERYETLDSCHPTKSGHKLMAKLWIEAINSTTG